MKTLPSQAALNERLRCEPETGKLFWRERSAASFTTTDQRGSSKYRGVCWVKRDQKWAASISAGSAGKKSLGHYDDEKAAALAYDAAARKFHGEFATLNFPEERADDRQH